MPCDYKLLHVDFCKLLYIDKYKIETGQVSEKDSLYMI